MPFYPRRAPYNTTMDVYRLVAGAVPVLSIPILTAVPCRPILLYLFRGGGGTEFLRVTQVTCPSLLPAIYTWTVGLPHKCNYDYSGGIALAIPTGSPPTLWVIDADVGVSGLPNYFRYNVARLPVPF
jgi:hypothetical protein